MNFMWDKNSALRDYSSYTSCKDIFQAVCNEIGKYYQQKGFKYSKSRPKITYKSEEIKLEICFWSSGYNAPENYVLLEIIPSFYSLKLAKLKKQNGQKNDSYILGYPSIFIYPSYSDKLGTVRTKQIFGEDIVRYEDGNSESVLKISNTCNIYGITIEKFLKIIEFIDNQIIYYLNVLENASRLQRFIDESNNLRSYYLKNENLIEYIDITFHNDKEKIICNLKSKLNGI